MNISGIFRIVLPHPDLIKLDDFRKADNRVKWGAQLMGHVSKEVAFGEVGCLRRQHRLMCNRGGLFGLLLRLQKGEAGIAVFRQAAQLGTVAI